MFLEVMNWFLELKLASKKNPDAIICLGSVIQGETKHFDFVCNAVAMGIKDLNISWISQLSLGY